MNEDSWRVRLELPAENRYLHIVRLTASGAAAEAGLDAAEVEDVKIAVDELCSVFIAAASAEDQLVVDFTSGRAGLNVVVHVPAGEEPEIDELGQAIIAATVDSIEFEPAANGGEYRLTKSHRGG